MTMQIPLSPHRVHRLPGMLVFGLTDVGPVRQSNEDNFLLDEALGLAMVADGMGGHAAGEVASAGVLNEVQAYLAAHGGAIDTERTQFGPGDDPDATWSDSDPGAVNLLHTALAYANERLYAHNHQRKRVDGNGMGTTLTGFWRRAARAPLVLFHVGDSRLYRLRMGVLEQLTRDQTMYQQALEAGLVDSLPARNLLLQAVGPSPSIAPEVRAHLVLPGDVLMLCSDGLHGSVPHAEIEAAMGRSGIENLEQVCAQLVEMAKQYRGRDNITVLLAVCAAA